MKLQHLPVLSAVFCAAFFSPATAQTTATWTLAGNGNWSTGANWSTNPNAPINGQPAPEDLYNAVLDTANRTITVDVPVVVQNFTQTTGTITGASTLTINGLTTFSGGTISGAGVINALGGMSLSGGIKTITGTGRQVNHGDGVNPSLATLTGGVLSIQGVAAFSNKLGATIDVSVDGTVIDNIQGSLSTFTNEGIITKSDGAGASTIQGNLTFNNTGTVNVNSGTLVMTLGPATHTDSAFNVASGATLRFGGNTHTFGGTTALSALGTGAVQFSAGTCNFNAGSYTVGGSTIVSGGTANLNIPATTHALVVSSGTFGGTGAVTVNGTATWSGGTMSGAGATTLLGGMSLEGGNKSIRTGRQVNHGNGTNPSLATLTAGVLDIGGAGEFNNKAATTFDVSIDGTIIDNTQGSFSSFNNAGTFTKSAGAGTSTIQGNIAFNNSGVVNVNSGTLALSVTGAHSGAFNISSGASLVASNFHTLNSGTVFTGAGTTSLTGSSRFTVNSPVTMSGPLSINLSNSGDTAINGSATLTINGLMTWTRGALNTLGVTQANGGVNFTGSDPKNISANRTLNLAGNSTWTNGNINIGGGGVLANQSGGIFETNFDGSVTNTFGSLATFNNEGIFTKSAGTATTAIAITFNNTGTVNVNSGTLRFGTGGTHTGGAFNIGAGATLDFNGGTHDITAGASVSGAGTLQISSGTVTVNGDYTHTGAILANGGTGTILVDNENVASVTVSGGTLSLVTGTLASPSVVLSSGNLGGSATVNASSFTWSGGGLRGSTQLNVATTLDLTAVAVKQLPNANGSSAVLTNNGTATFGGGNLQISSTGAGLAGQFVNNGTFNATDNGTLYSEISAVVELPHSRTPEHSTKVALAPQRTSMAACFFIIPGPSTWIKEPLTSGAEAPAQAISSSMRERP